MKLLSFLSNKKESKKIIRQSRLNLDILQLAPKSGYNQIRKADNEQIEALIQTGRQQFKKLQELGLKIPIAVL